MKLNLGFFLSGHPWIRDEGNAPDTPLDAVVLNRLRKFSETDKLKKIALKVYFKYFDFWMVLI